jgi:hypothetical protein
MHGLIERLRAEFLEMPGLRLTPAQVGRLCGMEQSICQIGLDELVGSKFLRISTDGTYVRATEGAMAPPHPAKTADTRAQRRRTVAS